MSSFAKIVRALASSRRVFATLAVAAFGILAAKAAMAQPFQVAPNIQQLLDQQLQVQQNQTVTIQGGGLQFLDAHEIAERDYNVVIRSFQNNNTQRWVLIPAGTNIYRIQQVSSGRYLDAHEIGGADYDYRVVTRPYQDNDTQLWRITNYGGGFVTIQQVSSGRFIQPYLDAAHDYQVVTRPGASATQPANDLQTWRLGSP